MSMSWTFIADFNTELLKRKKKEKRKEEKEKIKTAQINFLEKTVWTFTKQGTLNFQSETAC